MEVNLKELPRLYKRVRIDRKFKTLKNCKSDFLIRIGSECNELVFDGKHTLYQTANKNFPSKFMYLFNLVQTDARKYLQKNPIVDVSPKVPVTLYNFKYDHEKGTLTGTDLDHAFWRIAYVKGYISKKTYDRALDEKAKAIRLASLSVLGSEKVFQRFVDGEFYENVVTRKNDPQLQSVYHDIRYSCYYMMHEISIMLGEEFDCYKTDCIYYRDTEANRKIVHDYFEEREMLFKQLVYSSMDSFTINE
jgi:hypothetical protein